MSYSEWKCYPSPREHEDDAQFETKPQVSTGSQSRVSSVLSLLALPMPPSSLLELSALLSQPGWMVITDR